MPAATEIAKPTVVLLHGILVTERAMRPLERHITRSTGLRVVSLTYYPRRSSLAQTAQKIASEIRELHPEGRPEVFAVACSLGSVVLRHVMALPDQGGISWTGSVLIAPPSQGSMVARKIAKVPLIGWIVGLVLGKAGRELGDTDGSTWAPPPQPCGVIAGTKAVTLANPVGWVSNLFRIILHPNDGTIATAETKVYLVRLADSELAAVSASIHYFNEVMDGPQVHSLGGLEVAARRILSAQDARLVVIGTAKLDLARPLTRDLKSASLSCPVEARAFDRQVQCTQEA